MTYLVFLAALLVAAAAFGVAGLVGVRINFETVFKAVATVVTFVPLMLLSALYVLVVELAVCAGGLVVLHITGLVRLEDISNRHTVLGLWILVAVAVALVCFNARHLYVTWKDGK
jgi:hypothetical protein